MKSTLFAALLITSWPNGTIQKTPSIDLASCQLAASFDLSHGAVKADCISNLDPISAGFKPGWNCISNYNCD